jgi:hypothetical protein
LSGHQKQIRTGKSLVSPVRIFSSVYPVSYRLDVSQIRAPHLPSGAGQGQLKVASSPTTGSTPATASTTSTTPAATATAATTAVAATPTARPASATTAAAIVGLRTCFVHHDGPAHHIFSIERGDGLLQFRVVSNFYEAEPTRLTG